MPWNWSTLPIHALPGTQEQKKQAARKNYMYKIRMRISGEVKDVNLIINRRMLRQWRVREYVVPPNPPPVQGQALAGGFVDSMTLSYDSFDILEQSTRRFFNSNFAVSGQRIGGYDSNG